MSKTYKYHHTATELGYIRKAENHSKVSYKGRFGKGYKKLIQHPNSTRYHLVEYYIEEA